MPLLLNTRPQSRSSYTAGVLLSYLRVLPDDPSSACLPPTYYDLFKASSHQPYASAQTSSGNLFAVE